MKQPSQLGPSVDSLRRTHSRPDGVQEQQAEYQPPVIVTYTSEEIAEKIGPAQACSPSVDCSSGIG